MSMLMDALGYEPSQWSQDLGGRHLSPATLALAAFLYIGERMSSMVL